MRSYQNLDSTPLQKDDSLKDFFLLFFVLSVPIWLVGEAKLPLPVNLPVSALTTFVPVMAASILSFRQQGSSGIKALLPKTWDY